MAEPERVLRRTKSMTARFGRETWSLVVPKDWRAWHDDQCATLVGPGDIGALQISAAFKDSEVLEADLRDFASGHLDDGTQLRGTQAGEFVGFEIAFSDGDRSWRHWYLRCGRQMLFVTYICNVDARGLENAAIHEALASLKAESHGVA